MTIRDNNETSPMGLRALYSNPRNPLKNLPDDSPVGAALLSAVVAQPPSGLPGGGVNGGGVGGGRSGGGGGGVGVGGGSHCPAVGQYTWARSSDVFVPYKAIPMLVEDVKADADWLWNPISRTFHQVVSVKRVSDVECVCVVSMREARQIVSLTHPVIRSIDDATGVPIQEVTADGEAKPPIVSYLSGAVVPTYIKEIVSVGKCDVIEISLADGFIYTTGTVAAHTLLGHNLKVNPPDDPSMPFESEDGEKGFLA